jgi:putative transposase
MPRGLKHFQQSGQLHFLTFSCYRRRPNFTTPLSRACFESSLERVRKSYGLGVYGYVVIPEHVHLLVNEPERGSLAQMLQSLKQSVARTLALRTAESFWQARYYDFNVWSEHKFRGEAEIHPSQPSRARIGRAPRRLAMEQLSSLFHRRKRSGRNRITMHSTTARKAGDCSDSSHSRKLRQSGA